VLLVVTWLQDAHFLAEGDAKYSFARNLVFSAARLLLPVPVVLLAWRQPVAVAWAVALGVSAVAALLLVRLLPRREATEDVSRAEFVRSAVRNVSGSAAEFLPGLLLAPLVLALHGPEEAAYFGIAWTAATLIFLASAAISRSAMAEIVRNGPSGVTAAVGRGAVQHLIVVVPAAILGAMLAPWALGVFGPDYAFYGTPVLIILCASAVFVAPTYLYLAYLRAVERPLALNVFPAAMIAVLAVLAPLLAGPLGTQGVALAWLLANIPFAFWGAWRLRTVAKEVTHDGPPSPVHRSAYAE
jgi:O-antigen/teichoic acid export membrane protein